MPFALPLTPRRESLLNFCPSTREIAQLLAASSLAVLLDRRAGRGPIGAEHAAIARFGLQPGAASAAIVEELASVGRHRLHRLMAAGRTNERGFKLHALSRSMMPPDLNSGKFAWMAARMDSKGGPKGTAECNLPMNPALRPAAPLLPPRSPEDDGCADQTYRSAADIPAIWTNTLDHPQPE
jgi:hypothetical protein